MTIIERSELTNELNLIIDQLDDIDCRYFSEDSTYLENGRIVNTGQLRSNESSFVSQLIGRVENTFRENGIHIDKLYQTDQPKQLIFKSERTAAKYDFTFSRLFDTRSDDFFKVPDIVVHAGPKDLQEKNQIFLSEVKTEFNLGQKKFDIDLFKVNVCHEELVFQNTAFVIVNNDLARVERLLSRYLANDDYLSPRAGLYLLVKPDCKTKTIVVSPR